jgi:SAM-dependent methyltransferase
MVRACGICAGRDYQHWWSLRGYDIGRCRSCGLVQVMQEMTEESLAALYGQGYYEGENDQVYQNYLATKEQKTREFGEKLDAVCRAHQVTTPGALLEIGCAFGLGLDAARTRGWTVKGIEASTYAAKWGRERLGLDITNAPLSSIPTASQDMVVMWDVIEHLIEPGATLREVRRILRPGGTLALSTGDIGSIGAKLYGKRWFLIAPPHHMFYFDRATIARALVDAGFAVTRIDGEGHPLDNANRPPFMTALARREKYIAWRFPKSAPIMTVIAR